MNASHIFEEFIDGPIPLDEIRSEHEARSGSLHGMQYNIYHVDDYILAKCALPTMRDADRLVYVCNTSKHTHRVKVRACIHPNDDRCALIAIRASVAGLVEVLLSCILNLSDPRN